MRALLLLAVHGLVSATAATAAMIVGPGTIDTRAGDTALLVYTAFQLVTALVIAAAARPGRKVLVAILATAAAAWALWCGLIAGMALSGVWQ